MVAKLLATDVVTKLVPGNPRRRGSIGAELWDMYSSGDTVGAIESRWDAHRATVTPEEAKKKGAVRMHLKWDVEHHNIRVSPAEEGPTERRVAGNGGIGVEPTKPLTLAEAKAGLGLTFGVPPSAIEIIVRG